MKGMTEKENCNTQKNTEKMSFNGCELKLFEDAFCVCVCDVFTKQTQILLICHKRPIIPCPAKIPPSKIYSAYFKSLPTKSPSEGIVVVLYNQKKKKKRKKSLKTPKSMLRSLACMCVIITVSCVNHSVEQSEMLTDPERTPLLLRRL